MSREMGRRLLCILTTVISLTCPSIPRCASGKWRKMSPLAGILSQYFLGTASGIRNSNRAGWSFDVPLSFPSLKH